MKRYLRVYAHILSFAFKNFFAYRTNMLIRSLYFPTWQIALYGIVSVIYQHTPVLGGWNREEGILLYFCCQLFMGFTYLTFFEGGARYFMDKLVRFGELDFILMRPLNPQFLSMFSRPEFGPFLSMFCLIGLMLNFLSNSTLMIPTANWLLFGVSLLASYLVVYFVVASYATLSFYSAQSRQMIEILDKATEYAQYPMDVFVQPARLFLLTILPIFFFGNISASVLLGKAEPSVLMLFAVMLPVSFVINQLAWSHGLKRYSSASS